MDTYSNGYLRADVAELGPDGQEQIVLLPEWAGVVLADLALLDLHVGVGDLRHGRQEEQDDEQANEASDTEVNPLDVPQASIGVEGVGEEDARREQRRDERSHTLDGLGEVQPDLRVPRGATDGQERVGGGLEGREAHADDEHAAAEAAERLLDARWPEQEAADGEDGEPRHEGHAEAEAAQDPAGDGGRADEVGAEVGGREAGRHAGADVEGGLEVGVENCGFARVSIGLLPSPRVLGHWLLLGGGFFSFSDCENGERCRSWLTIEKTVGETPEEEQNGN